MRVLLTNDDGIDAPGLRALRAALQEVPGVDLVTIAPDGNRSAIGRGITVFRPLHVERLELDGTPAYACDGTPVDCVRLAALGLVEGWAPDVVASGINHGSNLGDDVTYSGTVAAALEGIVLGLPAVAFSQQSVAREMDFRLGEDFAFGEGARFAARLLQELDTVPLPPSTLLNVNFPAGELRGVEVCRLGKRIYRDQLTEAEEQPGGSGRRFWIYGAAPTFEDEPGTDLAAVHAGRVAITPMHLDLTQHDHIGPLSMAELDRLVAPAAAEVEEQ
jgi:5'-nucleotidase